MKLDRALVLALLGLLCAVGNVGAEPASSENARRAHAIARDVMSPYCPGRTLADCPSPSAAALREEIRELVDQGVDERTIRERLEARFGDMILGVPRSVLGWVLPGVILALGGAAVMTALRRLSRRPTTPSPEDDTKLEEELDRELGL
ncbi:MAG: cytochrome c-type biogenesis protein CcmH [Myxococcota bacterium]